MPATLSSFNPPVLLLTSSGLIDFSAASLPRTARDQPEVLLT